MLLQVRIVFKNGEQRFGSITQLSEVEDAVKRFGYSLEHVREIHFGG